MVYSAMEWVLNTGCPGAVQGGTARGSVLNIGYAWAVQGSIVRGSVLNTGCPGAVQGSIVRGSGCTTLGALGQYRAVQCEGVGAQRWVRLGSTGQWERVCAEHWVPWGSTGQYSAREWVHNTGCAWAVQGSTVGKNVC
jgi:hypothetical protein